MSLRLPAVSGGYFVKQFDVFENSTPLVLLAEKIKAGPSPTQQDSPVLLAHSGHPAPKKRFNYLHELAPRDTVRRCSLELDVIATHDRI